MVLASSGLTDPPLPAPASSSARLERMPHRDAAAGRREGGLAAPSVWPRPIFMMNDTPSLHILSSTPQTLPHKHYCSL